MFFQPLCLLCIWGYPWTAWASHLDRRKEAAFHLHIKLLRLMSLTQSISAFYGQNNAMMAGINGPSATQEQHECHAHCILPLFLLVLRSPAVPRQDWLLHACILAIGALLLAPLRGCVWLLPISHLCSIFVGSACLAIGDVHTYIHEVFSSSMRVFHVWCLEVCPALGLFWST